MKIFFDTSAFIALFIENESFHEKVVQKFQSYQQARAVFFTSEYVLDELFTWLLNHFGENTVKQIITYVQKAEEKNEIKILNIDSFLFKKAVDIFIKFAEHKISFTDAISYILCKDLNLDEIFTLDHDFKKMRLKTSF